MDYDSIKAAVIMFTKDLANYLAKDNILVNAVCPGPIPHRCGRAPDNWVSNWASSLGCQGWKPLIGSPSSTPPGTSRRSGRYRLHGGLPGLGESQVHHRAGDQCRWWDGEDSNLTPHPSKVFT